MIIHKSCIWQATNYHINHVYMIMVVSTSMVICCSQRPAQISASFNDIVAEAVGLTANDILSNITKTCLRACDRMESIHVDGTLPWLSVSQGQEVLCLYSQSWSPMHVQHCIDHYVNTYKTHIFFLHPTGRLEHNVFKVDIHTLLNVIVLFYGLDKRIQCTCRSKEYL